jgi:pyruvate/2-oxoglutarate/acetoin dehydrogenase E1 component
MTYKESITAAMTELGRDPLVCFVGYGLKRGRAGGTLSGVREEQIIEMPVAEALMTSVAIGLSLAGKKPVVYYERADFLLNAADAIVNHLNAMRKLSDYEFNPTCILRVVIGNKTKPLFTGPVHTQNFVSAFRAMVSFPVHELRNPHYVEPVYRQSHRDLCAQSAMIFEFKDML